MSILIKGAKMPKGCKDCSLNYDYYRCEALGDKFDDREEIDMETQRLSNCPLVEIPPHGRLIDADKLDRHFIYASDDNIAGMGYVDSEQEIYNEAIDDARLTVQDAPTVIESEEQEHE